MRQRRLLAWLAVVAVALVAVTDSADAQQIIAAPRKRTMRPPRGAAARVSTAVGPAGGVQCKMAR